MPMYEYVCFKCKTRFELLRALSERDEPAEQEHRAPVDRAIGFADIQPETRILLVISENDVVTGHVLFDEVALKYEGLLFSGCQNKIKAAGLPHHKGCLTD